METLEKGCSGEVVLEFLLLTFTPLSSVTIVNFEQVNVSSVN